jgi:hypothetical protein
MEEIFARHAAPVEELRAALRHEEVTPGFDYNQNLSFQMAPFPQAMRAARFLWGESSHRHRQKEDARAVDLLLMGLALAQDSGRDGPVAPMLVGIVCEGLAIEGWRSILGSYNLSPADLERAAKGMDTLWRTRFALSDVIAVEDLTTRLALSQMGLQGYDSGLYENASLFAGRTRKFLFSRRMAYAGALPLFERFFRDLGGVCELPVAQRETAAFRIEANLYDDPNPAFQAMVIPVSKTIRCDALAQMNWTLMRVATAIAWYESENGVQPSSLGALVPRYLPVVPDCPFTGKPLGFVPGKIWSYGVDGIDHGGKPNPRGVDDEPGWDVVWFVKREK